jgi:hypothetical protein
MDLSEQNYISLPYYRNHDLEEAQYREQFSRDQLLTRINQSILAQQTQVNDILERPGVEKQANICHGCGHLGMLNISLIQNFLLIAHLGVDLGHSRPNCPYKDHPGWIARGKRNHPLDVGTLTITSLFLVSMRTFSLS